MNDEIIKQIKRQSILHAARLLNIEFRTNKVAFCYKGHDTNASLNFNEQHGYFKCFGCEAKGDIITLVQDVKSMNFTEACSWLIFEFNLSAEAGNRGLNSKSISRQIKKKKSLDKEFNRPNQIIYEWVLRNLGLSKYAAEYLINIRGFPEAHIHTLEIRDIEHPRVFFSKLRAKFDVKELLDCGLLKKTDTTIKDLWWDHVILFPFRDSSGDIKYMQGRRMVSSTNKYINLSRIKPGVYNSQILNEISHGDMLLICEGVPDTITAGLMGFNAIGILGASNFDSSLVELLLDYRIQVVPDADNGGEVFLNSIREAFYIKGKTVQKIKIPPPYNDLNEFYNKANN